MRIGIDFDNTIAGYDRLFGRLAVEQGLLAAAPAGGKRAVRDALRGARPDGDLDWQRLQALAYGRRMREAELIAGVDAFLAACRARDVPVCIVSHKTRHAAMDPERLDLREAALGWMRDQGFFEPDGFGLDPEAVHFEASRAAKVARIAALDCTHFIDDLEEVFAEPGFPEQVDAILFDPSGAAGRPGRWRAMAGWPDIQEHLLGRGH